MEKPVIGILTYREGRRFSEPDYFRSLIREGRKLGADVYLFTERDILYGARQIRGYVSDKLKRWRPSRFPWPDVVIDRRRSRWTAAFKRMRRKELFTYANSRFKLKWQVTKRLAEHPDVRKWIPETKLYSRSRLEEMLGKHSILYVKPGNGTGGQSVVRIVSEAGRYVIEGRKRSGRLTSVRAAGVPAVARWLERWMRAQCIRSGRFMLQQGLDLELVPGRVVDSRLLIQKNGRGEWEVTGIGTRVSGRSSPTTNLLYGDGKGCRFDPFMARAFGDEEAKLIRAECEEMSHKLVQVLEQMYGPMLEFGLDVGIDVNKRVWLIEANPKPSRDLFLKISEPETYRKSIRRPIQYANYLAVKNRSRE